MLFLPVSPHWASAEGLRGGFDDAFGPRFRPQARSAPPDVTQRHRSRLDRAASVRHWNQIAIDASGLDHTPVLAGENRIFGEQLGPGRSSRAMAIVHLAVFEVVNALEGHYKSYLRPGPGRAVASMNVAISQAAHDTLAALYPSQSVQLDLILKDDLEGIAEGPLKSNGIALGKRIAAASGSIGHSMRPKESGRGIRLQISATRTCTVRISGDNNSSYGACAEARRRAREIYLYCSRSN